MFNENTVMNLIPSHIKETQLKMGVRGLGTDSGVWISGGIIGMRVGVFRKISEHGTVLLSSCSYRFQCYL